MTDKIKLSDLPLNLELHDCEIIASAINYFGSGDHPMAEAQKNLDYFDIEYIVQCLDSGYEQARNESVREEVEDLAVNIHASWEEMKDNQKIDHNRCAFSEGQVYKDRTDLDKYDAFDCYKKAVAMGRFEPSVSASVCFVAGYLGNDYPEHDDRVTS